MMAATCEHGYDLGDCTFEQCKIQAFEYWHKHLDRPWIGDIKCVCCMGCREKIEQLEKRVETLEQQVNMAAEGMRKR